MTIRTGFIALMLAMAVLTVHALAADSGSRPGAPTVRKTSVNDVFAPMDINNIFSYFRNNGDGALNPFTGDGGFELLSARRGITVFEEGIVFGGYHNGILKVGGSTYNQAWQAGRIITPAVVVGGVQQSAAVAADPNDPKNRIYRARPDVNPKTAFADVQPVLAQEAMLCAKYDNTVTPQSLYDSYLKDWNEWPASEGAPYKDVNGDGTYDPTVDIPGVPGADQTMWYVVNDLDVSRTHHLYGSDPIGIEMQKTIWAYRLSGALGNTIFQKTKLINKSGCAVDSMYVGQWADCDLGGSLGYKDDYAGCDSVLGLGFTYNGTDIDGFFASYPPAIGFSLMQGPIVKASAQDRAAFNGGYRYGYKNLPMTSFNFFFNSNNIYRDATLDNPKGAFEMYNLLKGLIAATGEPYIDPTTARATKFPLAGDPVTQQGWTDGTIAGPDDRRQMFSTGPFTLAAGDTQEVVAAEFAAQAGSRFASVTLLKSYCVLVRQAYDSQFDLPKPPAAPFATIADSAHNLKLDWSDPVSVQAVEVPVLNGYAFQGYNVYQLPMNGPLQNAKRIATFDLVDDYGIISDSVYSPTDHHMIYTPIQYGANQGIQRSFTPEKDYITDQPLIAGETYSYVVTAYSINPAPGARPKSLESMPIVLSQLKTVPATLHAAAGDVITLKHTVGTAMATTDFTVVNPYAITGHEYEVSCVVLDSLNTVPKLPNTKWQVKDKTTGALVLAPTNNFLLNSVTNPVVDGIRMGFKGTPYKAAGSEVGVLAYAAAGVDIDTVETMTASNWRGVNNGLYFFGGGFDIGSRFRGSTLSPDQINKTVEIRFSNSATQKAYAYLRTNATSTSTYNGFKDQPFTVWDVTDAANPRQLDFVFLEQSGSSYQNDIWAPGALSSDREYFYISNETYTPTEKPEYVGSTEAMLAGKPMLYGGWFTLKDPAKAPYADGDRWRIVPTRYLTTSDRWTFSTADLAPDLILGVKEAATVTTYDLAQNYPNPFNPSTTIDYQLPHAAHVKLIIYDLLGREVATLIDAPKNMGRYTITWNAASMPSGVYFYRLTAGSYSMTKKLMLLK